MASPFIGKVDATGRIDWSRPRALQGWLLRNQNRWVRAKLTPISEQHAGLIGYWFAVVVPAVAARTRYSGSQAHMLMLIECFGVIHDGPTGRQIPKQAS